MAATASDRAFCRGKVVLVGVVMALSTAVLSSCTEDSGSSQSVYVGPGHPEDWPSFVMDYRLSARTTGVALQGRLTYKDNWHWVDEVIAADSPPGYVGTFTARLGPRSVTYVATVNERQESAEQEPGRMATVAGRQYWFPPYFATRNHDRLRGRLG